MLGMPKCQEYRSGEYIEVVGDAEVLGMLKWCGHRSGENIEVVGNAEVLRMSM